MLKKKFVTLLLIFLIFLNSVYSAEEVIYNENSINIQAVETTQAPKYPDYSKMYAGEDKHEKFNRKMFNLNSKLNKFIARPVHIIWSSIMPKYGIDRIRDVYNNIEYPKRLISCLVQRDGQGIKQETVRFLTNTTLGLGGLFDPADRIFKVKPTNENMEQALCKCKMNSGSYLVIPVLHSCTPRSLCGRTLEAALDPAVYLASPIVSAIKFGLMLNRTSYMQPLAKMIETTYADPYDIHKKLFGLENYIKNSNYDRKDLLKEEKELVEEGHPELAEELMAEFGEDNVSVLNSLKKEDDGILADTALKLSEKKDLSDILPLGTGILKPDIILMDYKPQTPIVDSMRTALFENPSINKSIWNELSIWNRSFANRVKTASIIVTPDRAPYVFKYILQKDKSAPLIIIYPSIGEGAGAHHSIVFAKMFYDEGFSVLMQGSHFHWEFVKSMPKDYAPGIPQNDAEKIRSVTSQGLKFLHDKYNCTPSQKYIVGTSFGAMASIFVGDLERNENILNITKYIAISPPIDLTYALEQADKNSEEYESNTEEVKQKTALTAAKILQIWNLKNEKNFKIDTLPFTNEEGKLITTFFMRQKLSDLIYTIENSQNPLKDDLYKMINNMSFKDYVEKYLTYGNNYNEITKNANLYAISDFLQNNNNYRIYESLDDFFINNEQIMKLKQIAGNNLICLNCGAHLGYLYRKEFIEALKNDIVRN